MEARNRSLGDWFTRVRTGQILLPRFQRHEAWGATEITSLLESVLRGLPTGAALTLEIGDSEPFVARPLVGAPKQTNERVNEHLLDGQQRLTALWRALHDDYDDRVYLIGTERNDEGEETIVVEPVRTSTKLETRYPLWLNDPQLCWQRGWIPLTLCRPGAPISEIDEWSDTASGDDNKEARKIERAINRYATTIETYKLPFLSLPSTTSRETALDVFINLNTSSVKLTAFDIAVAQFEAVNEDSLHDQIAELREAVPRLEAYRDIESLFLDVAALREDRPPNQASYTRLDLKQLASDFDEIVRGAHFIVEVLESESIFDAERLPTVAVLPVLGAIEPRVPKAGDERGNAMGIVRAYVWRAFATSRYESSAGTRALQDLRGLIRVLGGADNTAPIFDEEVSPLPAQEELVRAGWPKKRQTLARAILCASLRRGAIDLADGAKVNATNVTAREYHHLFPVAYLEHIGDQGRDETNRALNCALISWVTNRRIGAKPPLSYLKDRIESADLGEGEIRRRLESHLIPWDEFAAPVDDPQRAYNEFLDARSSIVVDYLRELCAGREPNP